MKIKKILLTLTLVFSILFTTTSSYAIFDIEKKTKSSVVGDFDSGALFIMENIDEPLPIASISKLMTYFVLKDNIASGKLKMEDEVEISKTAASTEGSSLDLFPGDKMKIKDLVDGLMVVSGNDAAVAIAEAVAGSEKEFVNLMNEKAKELSLTNSTFINASGLTDSSGEANKMSSKDIFEMARALIQKYPEVLEFSKIRVLEQPFRKFKRESTIPLVGEVEGVDGLKTGYTDEAGYCLVSTMKTKKGNTDFRIISVLMGAKTKEERNQYMKDLLDFVKKNIETKKILDASSYIKRIKTNKSKLGYVDIVAAKDVERISLKNISYELEASYSKIKLPIKKGEKFGELKIKNSEEVIDTVDLVAKEDYQKASIFTRLVRFVPSIFKTLEIILP
ncbi:hypothetical protein HMPREF3188_00031 [Tissierellia bacterium KA00581]|jgi:hypothetical protein|nr:hypothetical protein HMPREF3188_00031 [Tissierellia bacterium KA00581]